MDPLISVQSSFPCIDTWSVHHELTTCVHAMRCRLLILSAVISMYFLDFNTCIYKGEMLLKSQLKTFFRYRGFKMIIKRLLTIRLVCSITLCPALHFSF